MSTSYIEKVLLTQKTGLEIYLPLDEESGTTAFDRSLEGNNATTKGLARGWNDRRMLAPDGGKCAQFDGSTTAIDFNGASSDISTTEGSISIWVAVPNAQLTDTTAMYIVKCAADANNYIDLSFDTTANQFKFDYKAGGTSVSSTGKVYNRHGALHLPEWHHFVGTYSATNDAVNLYIDGVAQTAGDTLGTWSGSFDTDLMCLGSSAYATPADQYTGWMAHFAWWSPILSQSEVDNLYKIGP